MRDTTMKIKNYNILAMCSEKSCRMFFFATRRSLRKAHTGCYSIQVSHIFHISDQDLVKSITNSLYWSRLRKRSNWLGN